MSKSKKAMLDEFRQMYAVEEKKSSPDKKQLARLKEKMNRVVRRNGMQSFSKNAH